MRTGKRQDGDHYGHLRRSAKTKVSNPAINVEFTVSAGYFDCATM
jgi:hypothetical protein